MSPYKILVTEDESIVAMDLKQRLEALGFEVIATVSTGAKAISQVESNLPDLILMDIQIKGNIDGIETAAKIQERFNIPIIFLTANSDTATIERAKTAGPLAYLLKPFEDRELKASIEIALSRNKLECELKEQKEWWRLEIIHMVVPDIMCQDKLFVSVNDGSNYVFLCPESHENFTGISGVIE